MVEQSLPSPRIEELPPTYNTHSRSISQSSIETSQSEPSRPLLKQPIRDVVQSTYTRATVFGAIQRLWTYVRRRKVTTPPVSTAATKKASRTAEFDGLRGLACLVVFHFHFLYPYTKTITHGFGADLGDPVWRYPHQLPFLCLLVRGRAMVTLFFAISGYVLSYNFLASVSIGSNPTTNGFSRLGSLALRRWMRLFLPASVSMLLVMFGAFFGAFEKGRELKDSQWQHGWWEQHPPQFDMFRAQLKDFLEMWWDWQSPWQWRLYYSEYDPHTWTIPVEFRGSLVLFILLLASAGLKQGWRFGLIICVTIYCFASRRWDVAAFTGGALVANVHICQTSRRELREKEALLPLDSITSKSESRLWKYSITALKCLLLLAALYVLSFPDDGASKTPGFSWLNTITPPMYGKGKEHPYKFWHAFAAIFILWAVARISFVKAFLSFSIPQYFGKISYGLYLVHGPLLHSAGFALQPKIFEAVGTETKVKYLGGLFLGWMTMLALSIVTAHLFWKFVDEPLVRFAKWLERVASHGKGS